MNDTIYTDTGLNTADHGWNYKVEMYNLTPGNSFKMGESVAASSVYLTTAATDNTVQLSWQAIVPWTNSQYVIWRQNGGGTYAVIDTVTSTTYDDTGLANDSLFCYKIETIGSYTSPAFVNPILNFSEEKCDTPVDNIPPCAVSGLTISAACERESVDLNWNKPDSALRQ